MVRRARLLVAATMVFTTLAVGSVAHAADSFRFYGSGYGHGIGMSQWGAYGLANEGWSYQRILTHFYSRTSVVESSTLPRRVRAALTRRRRTLHLTAKTGPVLLWLDDPGTSFVAKIPWGKTWTVSAARTVNRYAIRNHNGALVGHHLWG